MTDDQRPATEPVSTEPELAKADRPRPGPSPTSRARRAAAAGVQAAADAESAASSTRRPSPRPADARSADSAADSKTVGKDRVTVTKPAKATAEATATAAEVEPAARPHRVQVRSARWLAAVLAVLALLLAGASAWLVITAPGQAGSVNQRDQALSAAKSSVALILSYDYRSFDAGLATAKAQLTGRANSDYVQAMTSTIKPAAIKSKVVVQAQTDSAGVETVSADGKQVTVVVFGQQKVTNSALTSPRIDPFRVRATMNLVGGHWLVSKFDQI